MVHLSKRLVGGALALGAAALGALYVWVIMPWHLRWGATEAELRRELPGDNLVAQPRMGYTRAITIDAPALAVWPWLAQIGQGRGGLYSYDWLENLAGCDLHSADRIVAEWQLSAGDLVRLGPEGYPYFTVVSAEPGRALVLRAAGAPPDTSSWSFILDPVDMATTRLIVRSRGDYTPTVLNAFMWRAMVEPLNFIMERKMLYGIKQRAERHARLGTAATNS